MPAEAHDENRLEARIRAADPNEQIDSRRAELRNVADADRLLVDRLVGTDAPEELLAELARDLQVLADRLLPYHEEELFGFRETAVAGDLAAMFDHSPLIGQGNPLSPPMTLEAFPDRIVGRVTFGAAYEGPPGCVHGGYVAAAFDELLGATQSLSGAPGMTGTLTVRYRSPTPLRVPLELVGRLDRVEGRKVFVTATCHDGDVLTAEADGIFISLDPERFTRMRAERDERVAGKSTGSFER
jgi:acyl-coenzyme A thioesterase PaaI-like protein